MAVPSIWKCWVRLITPAGPLDSRCLYILHVCGGDHHSECFRAEHVLFERMSNSRHDTPFANSGIVVTLETNEFGSNHPLAGVYLQRQYESAAFELLGGTYACPIQRGLDFVNGKAPRADDRVECSYERGG